MRIKNSNPLKISKILIKKMQENY